MAQMLSPNPTRISQNLPIPKCSTCSQFVPLEELGDHICAPPSLPKPVTTSAAVAALLPRRLQGRTPSPGRMPSPAPSTSRSASRSPVSRDTPLSINVSSPMLTRSRLPQGDDSRAHTPLNSAHPISATVRETPTTARPLLARELPSTPRPTLSPGTPPRNAPPGQPPPLPAHGRSGTPLGYRGPPVGSSISSQATLPPGNMIPPRNKTSPSPQKKIPGTIGPGTIISETHAPRQSLVPPPERGIDTKIGGEAGMAGVGRRGFAAIARAAMFALPPDRRLGPQPLRKSNEPKYLDIDALSRRTLF